MPACPEQSPGWAQQLRLPIVAGVSPEELMHQGRENLGARGRVYCWWGGFKLVTKGQFAVVPCRLPAGTQFPHYPQCICRSCRGLCHRSLNPTRRMSQTAGSSFQWHLQKQVSFCDPFFLVLLPPIPRLLWVTISKYLNLVTLAQPLIWKEVAQMRQYLNFDLFTPLQSFSSWIFNINPGKILSMSLVHRSSSALILSTSR